MAVAPPAAHRVALSSGVPCVHRVPPVRCTARRVTAAGQRCVTRALPRLSPWIRAVCAPSIAVRQFAVPLQVAVQLHRIGNVRATPTVSHRVLVCRNTPAVRARVHPLPKRVSTGRVAVRWRSRARLVTIERFRCRDRRSSLVWRLPMTRRAVPFQSLAEEQRRQCQEALQRAAQGYARVQSVYYPVPAHAVARIEIDERRGVLYVHPRRGQSETAPACLWVVSGVQITDGRPVRAVLRVA